MFLGFENYRDIDVLKGKTLVEVERSHYDSNDALFFKTADGEFYIMTHNQDCCENVYIDDICGDFADLLNEEILTAQELHNKLCQANIIYKQSGQWNLHKPYKGWKLHDTNTYTFPSSNGGTRTKVYTVWTQRGRRFIIALFNNNFNVKLALAEINGNIAK